MNAFVYLSQTSESKYFVVLLEKSKANDKNKNFLAIEFRLLFDIWISQLKDKARPSKKKM